MVDFVKVNEDEEFKQLILRSGKDPLARKLRMEDAINNSKDNSFKQKTVVALQVADGVLNGAHETAKEIFSHGESHGGGIESLAATEEEEVFRRHSHEIKQGNLKPYYEDLVELRTEQDRPEGFFGSLVNSQKRFNQSMVDAGNEYERNKDKSWIERLQSAVAFNLPGLTRF